MGNCRHGKLDGCSVCEEIASLTAQLERAKAALLCPGQMRCAKCKFELSRRTLFALSGTVGAGTSETEPCPNGCGPLWPVTWEQEARSCYASLDRLFDEKQKAEAEHDETKALLVNSASTEKGVMPRGGMDADWWTVAIKERRTRKAAEAERDALATRVAEPCAWMQDGEGNWWTDCGEGHTFIDGGPTENSMKFCCYCGKTLKASLSREEKS